MSDRIDSVKDFVRLHGLRDPAAEAAIRDIVGTYEREIVDLKSKLKAYDTIIKLHADHICLNANDLFVRGADAVLLDAGDMSFALRVVEKFPKEGVRAVMSTIIKAEPLPGRAGREYRSAMNFINKHEKEALEKLWSRDLNDSDGRASESIVKENIRLKKELFRKSNPIISWIRDILEKL
jgi:hypothetical protein